jgi:hypothetical protein
MKTLKLPSIFKASRNSLLLLVFSIVFLPSCHPQQLQKQNPPFIKGVYGNPATLLKAGYRFDSLGMNAVFVRSQSLNQDFYTAARDQNCQVFMEFPTLNGKPYLNDHPEAWPINEKGDQAPPADWFMGICPTNPGFKTYRQNQLRNLLQEYAVDGVFLDYVHLHAQFETANPILPETCFCDHCTALFADHLKISLPGGPIPEKAAWILEHKDKEWRTWRNAILNGWIEDLGRIVKELRPEAKLGVFYCSWFPDDHDGALYRTLGIDVAGFAERADVLSPMLFHHMKNRPTAWVGEYLEWLDNVAFSEKSEGPLVWPIVQAHNNPGIISPEEFRKVMLEGSQPPSSGIMMFSDQSLLEDTAKLDVMKELYLENSIQHRNKGPNKE